MGKWALQRQSRCGRGAPDDGGADWSANQCNPVLNGFYYHSFPAMPLTRLKVWGDEWELGQQRSWAMWLTRPAYMQNTCVLVCYSSGGLGKCLCMRPRSIFSMLLIALPFKLLYVSC